MLRVFKAVWNTSKGLYQLLIKDCQVETLFTKLVNTGKIAAKAVGEY